MRRRYSVLLVTQLGLGCETESELPPIIASSEHLILRGEGDVCAGTFSGMESRVLAVQELFDAPAVRVEYNWLLDSFPGADCGAGAAACADAHEIFAENLAIEHELIHAARTSLLPAPLEEGLATFLGGNRMVAGTRAELRLAIETDATFSYQRASEFVQFLVRLGGFEKLRALGEQTGYQASFSNWRPVFEDIYGQPWDSVWEDYLETAECDPATMADDVVLCYVSTPSLNLTPEYMNPSQYMHDMSCDSMDVVGPVFGDEVRHEVLIELTDPFLPSMWVRLVGDVVSGSGAFLTRCGTCADESGVALTPANDLGWIDVPEPGYYVLELRRPIDEPGPLGVRLGF
jgi:hypothetical protein